MNAAESQPWPWHRWAAIVLALFALQAGAIWLLSEYSPQPKPPPPWPTPIHLAADPKALTQIAQQSAAQDPTLFALPHQHGFSGAAWLKFEPLSYTQKDWTEPPAWLAVNHDQLGEAFSKIMSSNLWPPALVANKPMPASIIPDFARIDFPMATNSSCRIQGELASRQLLEPLPMQPWAHTDLLTNSVVQVAVDDQGFAFSTQLLGACGLPAADKYALQLANQARFEPEPVKTKSEHAFTWGKIIFQWHTIPIPATNNPPPTEPLP
jgi:hypothetical protein